MSPKRCERDSNPQSAFADHRFFPSGDYALRLVAPGPLPVVASQQSTQDGIRTRKPDRARESESRSFTKISHLGIKYRRRGSNPQNSVFEADTYSSSVTPAQVPLVRFELTMDLSPARVLSPPHIPFCYRGKSTPGEIRTHTEPGLSRRPLPVGIREHIVGREGLEPSVFLV